MATVNAYLNFNGNCEEAFDFYQSIFGGEFGFVGRFKDMPPDMQVPAGSGELIMHISLALSSESTLMGSDCIPGYGPPFIAGNNISLSIDAGSEEEANQLFAGLSAGGTVTMPMDKTFWGAYFGMFTDKFGINWMMNYDYNQSTEPDKQQQQQQQQ